MNRTDFLQFENAAGPARGHTAAVEFRDISPGEIQYTGYASVTETEYPVYGGTFPGWIETMARGSFKKTLREKADVSFLINHEGMTLARTKSGTLQLAEDATGLRVNASLDPSNPDVQRLRSASKRGDVDEMSFGFRVTRDQWLNADGEPADEQTGTHRRILEVNMNKGDVSAVNYGANDATSGSVRALCELRNGRPDTAELVRVLAAGFLEERAPVTGAEMQLQRIEQAVQEIRAMFVVNEATDAEGTPLSWSSADAPEEARADALVLAYLALHEQLREPI